ncbi:hypothetical protein GCM10027452_17940 [Micromonospora halotolerans]
MPDPRRSAPGPSGSARPAQLSPGWKRFRNEPLTGPSGRAQTPGNVYSKQLEVRGVGRKRLQESADGRPTVHTVAARAGVSIASASRVLNGVGGSPETVRKVREAAAEVGYVPNAIARSLQSQRTGLVASPSRTSATRCTSR